MRRKKRSNVQAEAGAPEMDASDGGASSAPKKFRYEEPDAVPPLPKLTVREDDVLYWVARGKENAEIAPILNASPETIRKHVQNIRQKFGSKSRLAVIAKYWERKLYESNLSIKELYELIERLKRRRSGEK
ncbi:MAG: hypothetical protein DME33_15160 [Verrucomicrobia bacterium]|nr:MAG: hypothetical protein DME33_15160 [Verrucomicrobiota bacterium]